VIQNWKTGLVGACCVVLGMGCGTPEMATGDDVQTALSALGRLEQVELGADHVPTFLRGELGRVDASLTAGGARPSKELAQKALLPALERIAPAFRLSTQELSLRSVRTDDVGLTHARYDQVRNGLRVVGGELLLHVNKAGEVYAANGKARGVSEPTTLRRVALENVLRAAVGGIT
jgi:bacillolysin